MEAISACGCEEVDDEGEEESEVSASASAWASLSSDAEPPDGHRALSKLRCDCAPVEAVDMTSAPWEDILFSALLS